MTNEPTEKRALDALIAWCDPAEVITGSNGYVINPNATIEELEGMAERMQREIDQIIAAREAAQTDE